MIVILDNGHGYDTPGKCSPKLPDGRRIYEYKTNRLIVNKIADLCYKEGIRFYILVPEQNDISLAERCKRVNAINENCFLFSIHLNASTMDGSWGKAKGISFFTSKGKTKSDEYATILFNEAKKEFESEFKLRTDMSDGDPDWEENFYILKNTKCPAVLSENFFMDNREECEFLLTDEAIERIALVHFRAIKKIIGVK
jgi:N-acetylmuramoyl-L-alanine amidase